MSSDVYQTIEVPDDWAEAIESMKLAIVRHKAANWPEISSKDASAILVWLAMLAVRDDLSVNQTENNPGKNTELANETIATLRARIAELEAENAAQRGEVERLKEENADLRQHFRDGERAFEQFLEAQTAIAALTARLEAAEKLFTEFAKVGTTNGNPARLYIDSRSGLMAMFQPGWDDAKEGWYLIQYPIPISKSGPHKSAIDVVLYALSANWLAED